MSISKTQHLIFTKKFYKGKSLQWKFYYLRLGLLTKALVTLKIYPSKMPKKYRKIV